MTASLTVSLHQQRAVGLGLIAPMPLGLTLVRLVGLKFTAAPLGRIDTPAGPASHRSFFAFELSVRRRPLEALAPRRGGGVPDELRRPIVPL